MHRFLLITFLWLLSVIIGQSASAQDFFKDYCQYRINKHSSNTRKLLNRDVRRMKEAFTRYEHQTHTSLFKADTIFMVDYYDVQSAEISKVIWNRHGQSFFYKYAFWKPLVVKLNGEEYLGSYKPKFKRWVESSDTASYNKYGRQSSWFDAPGISFTVASKAKNYWRFVSSGTYATNVDQLPFNK